MSLRKIVTSGENHVFAVLLADKVGRHISNNAGPSYRTPDFHITSTKVTVQSERDGQRRVILVAGCVGNPVDFVMTLHFFHPEEWRATVTVDAWYIGARRDLPTQQWRGSARREFNGETTLNFLNPDK